MNADPLAQTRELIRRILVTAQLASGFPVPTGVELGHELDWRLDGGRVTFYWPNGTVEVFVPAASISALAAGADMREVAAGLPAATVTQL